MSEDTGICSNQFENPPWRGVKICQIHMSHQAHAQNDSRHWQNRSQGAVHNRTCTNTHKHIHVQTKMVAAMVTIFYSVSIAMSMRCLDWKGVLPHCNTSCFRAGSLLFHLTNLPRGSNRRKWIGHQRTPKYRTTKQTDLKIGWSTKAVQTAGSQWDIDKNFGQSIEVGMGSGNQ